LIPVTNYKLNLEFISNPIAWFVAPPMFNVTNVVSNLALTKYSKDYVVLSQLLTNVVDGIPA